MEIHQLVRCPGCGDEGSTPVPLDGQHELRRCDRCDLVYASAYGDPDEIYVEGYLFGETEFGLDIFHPLFQEFLSFAAEKRLDVIERSRPARGSLLDVGCGSGEVLLAAQRRGWTVAGAEPVQQSASIAQSRGLDVRPALLQDTDLPERSWDVVTAFHVLEHITEGSAFLGLLARWARPGGLVVVEVPNWGSVDRMRKGASWPGVRPLEHVAHYQPDTLRRTMERAGLEPVVVRTLGFLWDQQTIEEQLRDLAIRRGRRLLRRLGRPTERDGQSEVMPGRVTRRALLAIQAAYDRMRRGQVVLGVARVPDGP
ncbi:MAG: class I SAM-dependent methyltransferase [Acidimicrobiales bacterium]|nr:class I SAM-dependent methyltransferase [Acidimicrobiales bacterium]